MNKPYIETLGGWRLKPNTSINPNIGNRIDALVEYAYSSYEGRFSSLSIEEQIIILLGLHTKEWVETGGDDYTFTIAKILWECSYRR